MIKYNIMTLNELGEKLHEMYSNAPKGDSVTMIHLFGIRFANEIKIGKYSKKDIANAAKIQESYATEISKGINLAKYVIEK
jgi:hypothetical protein